MVRLRVPAGASHGEAPRYRGGHGCPGGGKSGRSHLNSLVGFHNFPTSVSCSMLSILVLPACLLLPSGCDRRAAVLGAAACACVPSQARAGYALQAASQSSQSWQATDKAKERAVVPNLLQSLISSLAPSHLVCYSCSWALARDRSTSR